MKDDVSPGSQQSSAQGDAASGTAPLEWVMAAIGLLLVCFVLSFLLYEALTGRAEPPAIAVQASSIAPVDGGYRVRFVATNTGGATAQGVIVAGELRRGGAVVERSWVSLDYLPAHSHQRGGLFFAHEPRRFELVLRALGYQEP